MMGDRRVDQGALFYQFSLERHVPGDHRLRSIDRFVDLEGVRAHVAPYYSSTGRPSVDPELMIRMLLVGYCFGIRSERRLCEEVHLNLAYRWFCRLGLDGDVPDHSTFSKNRHGRFRDSDLLRQVFETVVARCMAEGLVGREGFAVDASMVVADAHRQRGVAGPGELDPTSNRAVTEYLAVLDDAAFGGATRGRAEVHLAHRSGGALDRRQRRAGRLCLCRQLPDRPEVCGDHGCRSHHRRSPGRGHGGQDHDRPHRRSAWGHARAPRRRHRLRLGRDARLAGRRAEDRAAHPGVRQVRAQATGPSRAATSPTTRKATSTSVPPASRCGDIAVRSPRHGPA